MLLHHAYKTRWRDAAQKQSHLIPNQAKHANKCHNTAQTDTQQIHAQKAAKMKTDKKRQTTQQHTVANNSNSAIIDQKNNTQQQNTLFSLVFRVKAQIFWFFHAFFCFRFLSLPNHAFVAICMCVCVWCSQLVVCGYVSLLFMSDHGLIAAKRPDWTNAIHGFIAPLRRWWRVRRFVP